MTINSGHSALCNSQYVEDSLFDSPSMTKVHLVFWIHILVFDSRYSCTVQTSENTSLVLDPFTRFVGKTSLSPVTVGI
jgi:hypothetical protein